MLWIDPVEVVRPDRQSYLRLNEFGYAFASLDTGFSSGIKFIAEGFVAYYP